MQVMMKGIPHLMSPVSPSPSQHHLKMLHTSATLVIPPRVLLATVRHIVNTEILFGIIAEYNVLEQMYCVQMSMYCDKKKQTFYRFELRKHLPL